GAPFFCLYGHPSLGPLVSRKKGNYVYGRDAGRLGAAPWPWPAKATGDCFVLPPNQPLLSEGLEFTYCGVKESDGFGLDVVIQRQDSSVTYPLNLVVMEARRGFTLADRHFALEPITPLYLRLRASDP
ncbi:MAG: hypothetical protein KFF68_06435, partial [Desulfosarcina sp.]|nr:hypothetical protein [Desulfosarcina sp.]